MSNKTPPPGKKKSRKKQESYLFLLMGLILLGLLISGYFLFVEKFLQPTVSGLISSDKPAESAGSADGTPGQTTAANLFLAGEGQEIVLYFGKKGTGKLEKEVRKIPEEKEFLKLARHLMEGLIQGPFGSGYSVIPAGTQLRALFFHQGSFVVDFSRELAANHPGGANEEFLTVFSIVNTLTELDRKARVRIMINGNEVETLKGHISLQQVFSRNEEMISR
jgi:spore germination protein GerM